MKRNSAWGCKMAYIMSIIYTSPAGLGPSPVAKTLTRPSIVMTSPTTQLPTRSSRNSTCMHAQPTKGRIQLGEAVRGRLWQTPSKVLLGCFVSCSALTLCVSRYHHLHRAWHLALLLLIRSQQLLQPQLLPVDAARTGGVWCERAAFAALICSSMRHMRTQESTLSLCAHVQGRPSHEARPCCKNHKALGHSLTQGVLAQFVDLAEQRSCHYREGRLHCCIVVCSRSAHFRSVLVA